MKREIIFWDAVSAFLSLFLSLSLSLSLSRVDVNGISNWRWTTANKFPLQKREPCSICLTTKCFHRSLVINVHWIFILLYSSSESPREKGKTSSLTNFWCEIFSYTSSSLTMSRCDKLKFYKQVQRCDDHTLKNKSSLSEETCFLFTRKHFHLLLSTSLKHRLVQSESCYWEWS